MRIITYVILCIFFPAAALFTMEYPKYLGHSDSTAFEICDNFIMRLDRIYINFLKNSHKYSRQYDNNSAENTAKATVRDLILRNINLLQTCSHNFISNLMQRIDSMWFSSSTRNELIELVKLIRMSN